MLIMTSNDFSFLSQFYSSTNIHCVADDLTWVFGNRRDSPPNPKELKIPIFIKPLWD